MAGFNKCVEEIIQAAAGKIDRRQAAELLRKFNDTAKRLSPEERLEGLDALLTQARDQMVHRNEIFAIQAKRNELQFRMAVDNTFEKIRNAMQVDDRSKLGLLLKSDEPGSVRHALDVVLFGSPGKREGLVQMWQGAKTRFNIALVVPLEQQGLLGHWQDADTVASAIDVAWNPGSKANSPEAQQIGAILNNVRKLSVRRLNSVGSYVLDTPRVLFNSKVASPAKVRAMGVDNFVNFVKNLDLDQSYFKGMEDAEVDAYWRDLYKNLASGDNFRAPTGTFDGVGGLVKDRYRNLAATFSIDHDVPFASAKAYKEFVAALSDEPLQVLLSRRVDQIGRAVGLMEAFGPVPERFMAELFTKLEPHMTERDRTFLLDPSKTGKPIAASLDSPGPITAAGILKGTVNAPFKIINRLFHDAHPIDALKYMDGTTSAPVSGSAARLGAGVRMWASMASLGWGAFIQMTDMPIRVAQVAKLGKDPFEAALSPITAFAKAMPDKEQRLFYARLGVGAEMMLNEMAHQLGEVGYMPRALTRVMDGYFKLNGMYGMDIVGKRWTADFLSSNLAWALKNEADGANMINMFRSYGFTDEDFAKLRNTIHNPAGLDGHDIVDPDVIAKTDDRLYEKYLGVMNDLINSIVPTPGAREKAITLKGTRPGTWDGELLRAGMMFKSFPIMMMTRIYPQIHYEHGVSGTLATMVSVMMLWYIGDSAKSLAQGKTPRDMRKVENVYTAMLRSGFGGLYSDLITADYHRNGMDFTALAGGPVGARLNDVFGLASGTIKGDMTPRLAANKINRSIPNVHLFKTALDRAIMYGILEPNDPGVLERTDRELRERTGQERLF